MTKAETDRLVRTTVRLPQSLLSAAKHRAIDREMTLQELITEALRSYLAKGGRP